jgi:hypothetical protein
VKGKHQRRILTGDSHAYQLQQIADTRKALKARMPATSAPVSTSPLSSITSLLFLPEFSRNQKWPNTNSCTHTHTCMYICTDHTHALVRDRKRALVRDRGREVAVLARVLHARRYSDLKNIRNRRASRPIWIFFLIKKVQP